LISIVGASKVFGFTRGESNDDLLLGALSEGAVAAFNNES